MLGTPEDSGGFRAGSETQTKRRHGAQVQANKKSVKENNRLRISLSKHIRGGGGGKASSLEGLTKQSHTSVEMNSDEATSKQHTRLHTLHASAACSSSVTMVMNCGFHYGPVWTQTLDFQFTSVELDQVLPRGRAAETRWSVHARRFQGQTQPGLTRLWMGEVAGAARRASQPALLVG